MRHILIAALVAVNMLFCGTPSWAEEKAYLGTVISIDTNAKVLQVVTNDGAMIHVASDDKAAKNLDKIPLNSLIDLVVEAQPDGKLMVKSWKIPQGKSPCRVFDGTMCAP
jgi:hypothetical protein